MKTLGLLALLTAANAYLPTSNPALNRPLDDSKPTLSVNLKYNPDYERYEVYASANFTQERFLLGASQISIVVPKSVADQPLDVASSTASWADYSNIYAPTVAPTADFHGVHTLGKSVDFQKDSPFMLFSFTLKGGYVDGVRLFVNGQDPDSKQKGMMGGDFGNTVQNYKGAEYYKPGVSQADLTKLVLATSDEKEPAISVYPNPVTGDAVSVTAQRFPSNERLTLRMYSSTGVELSSVEENADKLVNYRLRMPKQLAQQGYLYVERNSGATGKQAFCQKLVILN